MRPLLKPALRRFWRDQSTVQFGVDPDSAVVISGVDPALAAVLDDLTGNFTKADVLNRATRRGVDPNRAAKLLALLSEAGALDSVRTGMRLSGLAPPERARLLPDLRSLSLRGGQSGLPGLAIRRKATVAVYGAGRVGGIVAVTLAAAGIGRVLVLDGTSTREVDLTPGGLDALEDGDDRATGVRKRIARFTRSTRTSVASGARVRPDLAIVAPDEEPDRGLVAGLVRLGIPHLVARVVEERGIVGPFVLPGRTSCVRCSDLFRADRDPAYPRLLAQQLSERSVTPACDVALAGLVGNLAAMHALQYVGGDVPDSGGSTIEVCSPSGQQRSRRWPAHPECGCHWEHLSEQHVSQEDDSQHGGSQRNDSQQGEPRHGEPQREPEWETPAAPDLGGGAESPADNRRLLGPSGSDSPDDGWSEDGDPYVQDPHLESPWFERPRGTQREQPSGTDPEFDLEMAGERLFPG